MNSSPFFTATPLPEMPPESIEMHNLTQSQRIKNSRNRIIDIIEIYEGKYFIFSALNITEPKIIFHKVREILLIDINIEIEELFQNDYNSFCMILAAFYRQKHALNVPREKEENVVIDEYLEKDFLPDCRHPLHTIMVMCYAAHSMQKIVMRDDFGQTITQEKYEQLKEQLEELACKIVNHFNMIGPNGAIQVRSALQADHRSGFMKISRKMSPYEEYLDGKFNRSKEIMTVAYKAKAMKFLSQRPCLNLMKIRNECRKTDIVNCDKHVGKVRMRYVKSKKTKLLVNTKTKLWFHAIFRGFYIAMFAYMLCKFPIYDDYDRAIHRTWKELLPFFYVLSVLIAQISMTFIKAIDYLMFHDYKSKHLQEANDCKRRGNILSRHSKWLRKNTELLHPYFHTNKLALWRISLVIPLLTLECIRFLIFTLNDDKFWNGGWVMIPILLELLYCSLFAIATVSTLRFFHFIQSLGFFVHLFKKMWKTVGMFVLIFCTFWFVLAVIHVSISRAFMSSTNTIFYTVASQGKFEIFGEVQDEDRVGILADCNQYNRTLFDFFDMDYVEASCLFRSSVMPFLVFTYIFVTGILLVNLLTAQLTKEYEKESEKSRYYKGYLKYEQLAKIESKLYLPPPLSLIYVLIRVIFLIGTTITMLFNCLTSCCCSSCCSFPIVSQLIWKRIVQKLEGYPWGAVRDLEDDPNAETEIQDFLRKSPDDIWEKLKEVVNTYDRKTLDVENLKNLKKDIDAFLEKETEEERERAQSRIGTERKRNNSKSQVSLKNRASLARIQSIDYDDPSSEAIIPLFV
ncbi:unnamed protein product [Caenorhabditis brenneri]